MQHTETLIPRLLSGTDIFVSSSAKCVVLAAHVVNLASHVVNLASHLPTDIVEDHGDHSTRFLSFH